MQQPLNLDGELNEDGEKTSTDANAMRLECAKKEWKRVEHGCLAG